MNIQLLTVFTDYNGLFVRVYRTVFQYNFANLIVAVAHLFGLNHKFAAYLVDAVVFNQFEFQSMNILQARQEPLVDFSHIVQTVN